MTLKVGCGVGGVKPIKGNFFDGFPYGVYIYNIYVYVSVYIYAVCFILIMAFVKSDYTLCVTCVTRRCKKLHAYRHTGEAGHPF